MNEVEKINQIYDLILDFKKSICPLCGDIHQNRNYYFDHSKHILLEIKKIAKYRIYVDGGGGIQKNKYHGKSRLFLYDPYKNYKREKTINPCVSTEAELRAVKKGIQYLKKLGIKDAIIYTDSKSSINSLVKKQPFFCEDYNLLAEDIRSINPGYSIEWIRCRDQLADPHAKTKKKKKLAPKKYRKYITEESNEFL